MIEKIVELGPELHPKPIFPDEEVSKQRKVAPPIPRTLNCPATQISNVTGGFAERVRIDPLNSSCYGWRRREPRRHSGVIGSIVSQTCLGIRVQRTDYSKRES